MSATLTFNEQTTAGDKTYVRPLHLRNGLRQLTGYLTESSYPTTGIDLNILNSYFGDLRSTIFQPKNGANQYKAEFDGARYLHLYQQIPVLVVNEAHTLASADEETITLAYPASYLLSVTKTDGSFLVTNSGETLVEGQCGLTSSGNTPGSVTIHGAAGPDTVYVTYLTTAFGTRRTETGVLATLAATLDYPAVFVESINTMKTTATHELTPIVGLTSAAAGDCKVELTGGAAGELKITAHTNNADAAGADEVTYISVADAAKWNMRSIVQTVNTSSSWQFTAPPIALGVPQAVSDAGANTELTRFYDQSSGSGYLIFDPLQLVGTSDETTDTDMLVPLLVGGGMGAYGWAEVAAGTAITDQIDMYLLGTGPRRLS